MQKVSSKKWLKPKASVARLSGWDVLTFQLLSSPLPSLSFPNKTLADPSPIGVEPHISAARPSSRIPPSRLCLEALPVTEGGESTFSGSVSAQLCFYSASPKADSNQLRGRGFVVVGLGCSKSPRGWIFIHSPVAKGCFYSSSFN